MSSSPEPFLGSDRIGQDTESELRACLRDLMGLLALPTLWSGREPAAVLQLLAETLEQIFPLEACYFSATLAAHQPPIGILRVGGEPRDASSPEWLPFVEYRSLPLSREPVTTREQTPCGELRVARFAMSYPGYASIAAIGSLRPDFPKQTEMVLLRAAASLAASGLRAARLVYEREQALRAKDEFLAMLGHELRNPLAPIVTAMELIRLRSGGQLTSEQQIIERQVGHLTALVDDLLDVTRITRGKVELKKVVVETATVVAKAVEMASPLLEQRGHNLSVDVQADGLCVSGDPRRLAQAVSNLLINAAKYTEPGGSVTIVAARDADYVRLSVIDNGTGIHASLLPRIFDLFQQGQVSADRAPGGLGIGLAIVKSLAALHGGTVEAKSEGPGCGSEFTLRLPIAAGGLEPAGMGVLPSAKTQARAKESILVVDDNEDAAAMLNELFDSIGHEVRVAHDPVEALAACEQLRPTVVIVDIGLPVMDGYELSRLIRARFSSNPPRIIAVTGYGQPQDQLRSREAGIELHLVKPVDFDRLLAAVHGR